MVFTIIKAIAIVFGLVWFYLCFGGNDNNHVNCDGIKFYKLQDVKMQSPIAQKIFDFYKSMLLDKKLILAEVFCDIDLRREWNKIRNDENLVSGQDANIIDALDTSFCHYLQEIAPSNIILNPEEKCYFNSQLCVVNTVQKIGRNVTYGGIRFNENGVRSGNCTIYSNDVSGFKVFDFGTVVVTNQRIIFKGENKNKVIPIGTILSVDNYEDNGVIISMSNRENPIIIRFRADKCFYHRPQSEYYCFYNDLNWFNKAIDKALYKRLMPKEVQDIRKEADELNFLVAKKTMVAEGLETE